MTHRRSRRSRPAFSLVEAAMAAALIGGLTVATLQVVGAAGASRATSARALTAQALAHDLLAEILAKRYTEDAQNETIFGVDPGESAAAARNTLDDVDDYHGLDEKPPLDAAGAATPYPQAGFLKRQTTVIYLDPTRPDGSSPSLTDQGMKLITVRVFSNNKPIATATGIKSSLADGAPK